MYLSNKKYFSINKIIYLLTFNRGRELEEMPSVAEGYLTTATIKFAATEKSSEDLRIIKYNIFIT